MENIKIFQRLLDLLKLLVVEANHHNISLNHFKIPNIIIERLNTYNKYYIDAAFSKQHVVHRVLAIEN